MEGLSFEYVFEHNMEVEMLSLFLRFLLCLDWSLSISCLMIFLDALELIRSMLSLLECLKGSRILDDGIEGMIGGQSNRSICRCDRRCGNIEESLDFLTGINICCRYIGPRRREGFELILIPLTCWLRIFRYWVACLLLGNKEVILWFG